MKLNFNLYILLIIVCIVMVFPYSNKENFHYQALSHFATGIFLYLILNPKGIHKHIPVQNNKQSSKELTEDELQCLKQKACSLSATQKECNTYSRCNWDNVKEKCNVRTSCEALDMYDCVKSNYCDFNLDGKGSCSFKTNVKGEIFNEDAKANRYCFKKNPEYIEDDHKGEFVEDQEYIKCIELCETSDEVCKEKCRREAVNRLSCNTIDGMKYENGICRKDKIHGISSIKRTNLKCLKVAQHSHNNPNKDGYIPHAPGYRTPYTFKINDDQKLRFIFNSFFILFIILLNAGIIKLFKN